MDNGQPRCSTESRWGARELDDRKGVGDILRQTTSMQMVRSGLSSDEWQRVHGKSGGGMKATTLVFDAGRVLALSVHVARRPHVPDGASSVASEESAGARDVAFYVLCLCFMNNGVAETV